LVLQTWFLSVVAEGKPSAAGSIDILTGQTQRKMQDHMLHATLLH